MTNEQLIELLEGKTPQELNLDEIELLRQRLADSPELREALAGHVRLDQYLAAALGRIEVSADAIFARAGRAGPQAGNPLLSLFGWGLCLLLVGFVGTLLVLDALFSRTAPSVMPELASGEPAGDASADDDAPPHEAVASAGASSEPDAASSVDGQMAETQERTSAATPGDVVATRADQTPNASPDKLVRIVLEAEKFQRGNVSVDTTKDGRGIGIIHAAREQHPFVEYDIDVPRAGKYQLDIRYTADKPRPVVVTLNGKVIARSAASEDLQDWSPRGQKWSGAGAFDFQTGKNVLRLETVPQADWRKQFFPHIDKIAISTKGVAAEESIAATPVAPAPWEELQHLGGPVRPFEEVAFEEFKSRDAPPQSADLRRWFTLSSGRIDDRDFREGDQNKRAAAFEGRLKLNAPWPADGALRFAISDYQGLKLHFWNAERGVSLQYYGEQRKHAWAAYQLRPGGDDSPLVREALLDTDGERNWRTNPVSPATYEVRVENGELALLRGDVVLLRVAFAGPPERVVFEGRAMFRHLALIHSTGLPPLAKPRPVAAEVDRPAAMQWVSELPQGSRLEKLDDGSVELISEHASQPAWAAFPLPKRGLHEIVFEVEGATPGSRVFLADKDGRPRYSVGFFLERRTGATSFNFVNPNDGRAEWELDPNDSPAPYAARRQWLRLVFGAGILKCETSTDGVHWCRPFDPLPQLEGPYSHVGIACIQGEPKRQIKLRRVVLRELTATSGLVAAELRERAIDLPEKVVNYEVWLDHVDKALPSGVSLADWHIACAVRSLGAGTPRTLGTKLVELLLEEGLSRESALSDKLALLDELCLLADTWDEQAAAVRIVQAYEQLGQALYRQGERRPYTAVATALRTAPLWSRHTYPLTIESLWRAELFELLYADEWSEAQSFTGQLAFWNHEEPLVRWAGLLASQRLRGGGAGDSASLAADKRHPLVEQLSKEGYNVLAEFEAALASKAYSDACQIITSAARREALGLLPDSKDPGLLVSLSGAVQLAIGRDPAFQKVMRDEFGPAGALRVRQAAGEGDWPAVAAAAVQFFGSDAAAEAYQVLGDRALAAGDFSRAFGHYQQAGRTASQALSAPIQARLRLSAAMLGRDSGQPIAEPVAIGGTQLTAAEFEKLLSDLRTQRGPSPVSGSAAATTASQAPAPSGYQAQSRARHDGEMGENPQDVPGAVRQERVDWTGRQLAVAAGNDLLLASNRFQLSAYDLKSGERKWQTAAGGQRGRTHDWSQAPMRPIISGKVIFVRRLMKDGPELAAINLADGKQLWNTRSGVVVASEPMLVQNKLLAFTVSRQDGPTNLSLTTFDSESGLVIAQQPLLTLRESWWQQRVCQAVAIDDSIVAVCGGVTLCCDVTGNVRWARRHLWLPLAENPDWANQHHVPPLVVGERLYTAQPGVRTVTCLDLGTGRLHWRKVLPTVKRIWGNLQDRLIVETGEGLIALSAKTGDMLWHHDAEELLEASLWGGANHIVYTCRERVKDDRRYANPCLVWLDVETGKPTAHTVLDALRDENPVVGPLVNSGDRLWMFSGRLNDPTRDLIELLPSGQAQLGHTSAPRASRRFTFFATFSEPPVTKAR